MALIKDLNIQVGNSIPWDSEIPEKKLKDIKTISIRAYVIIKRDNKLYKVAIAQSYDIGEKDDWVFHFNHCMSEFSKRCEMITTNWKLVDNDTVEGVHGKVIMQEEFNIQTEI